MVWSDSHVAFVQTPPPLPSGKIEFFGGGSVYISHEGWGLFGVRSNWDHVVEVIPPKQAIEFRGLWRLLKVLQEESKFVTHWQLLTPRSQTSKALFPKRFICGRFHLQLS